MAGKQKVTGNLAVSEQQRVIVIEATEKPQDLKLRVAAYTRVSSDSADQLNSFAAQNRYYTALISSKENWTMVDIYADRGITGTSVEKRDDFQRLISDCRRGLIDRVLCKSISRFARNTTDCLEAIRELKSLGIGITFEKEHIDTAKVSGEMLTALFAAMAQAESESICCESRLSPTTQAGSGTKTWWREFWKIGSTLAIRAGLPLFQRSNTTERGKSAAVRLPYQRKLRRRSFCGD